MKISKQNLLRKTKVSTQQVFHLLMFHCHRYNTCRCGFIVLLSFTGITPCRYFSTYQKRFHDHLHSVWSAQHLCKKIQTNTKSTFKKSFRSSILMFFSYICIISGSNLVTTQNCQSTHSRLCRPSLECQLIGAWIPGKHKEDYRLPVLELDSGGDSIFSLANFTPPVKTKMCCLPS